MTSDPEFPETPEGMAEDAKAFEDWEDAFIARNREAINKLLEEAHEDVRQGRVVEWNLEDALERGRRRYEEYLAKQRS
jgi:hypothetical protein